MVPPLDVLAEQAALARLMMCFELGFRVALRICASSESMAASESSSLELLELLALLELPDACL
jgi:hypothetical protein